MQVKQFEKLTYVIKLPESYDTKKKYPLIFVMHGAGGRGDDVEVLKTNPYFRHTEKHSEFPFISVAPLCGENTWFDLFETLKSFIKHIYDIVSFVDNRQNKAILTLGVEYWTNMFIESLTYKLGDGGTFYPDMFGKIAYFYSDPSVTGSADYALLKNIYYDEFDDKCIVELFTSNGEFIEYEGAKTIRVDGTAYKGSQQANIRTDILNHGNGVPDMDDNLTIIQLIKFTLNDEGLLSAIDTEEEGGPANELEKERDLANAEFISSDGSNNLTGNGYLSNSTKVFVVSKDKINDEKGYVCSGPGALSGIEKINGKIFDMSDSYTPAAMIAYKSGATATANNMAVMFDSFSEGLNDEGDVVKIMTVYEANGTKQEYTCTKDVSRQEEGKTMEELHRGDLIRFSKDSQQQIARVSLIINYNQTSTRVVNGWGDGRFHDEYRDVLGVVTEVGGSQRVKVGILDSNNDVYTEDSIVADTSIAANVRDLYRTFIYALHPVNYGKTNFVVYDRAADEIYVTDESIMNEMIYDKTENPDVRIFLATNYSSTQRLFLFK